MVKQCWCGKWFEGSARKKYCSSRCKKNYENSLRTAPEKRRASKSVASFVLKPETLNEAAAKIWDNIAPTLIARGHLNILSADSFAELCDLYSRLLDVNRMINERNRSLLQSELDGKSLDDGSGCRESSLSDLKRKYSKQFLDYCKEFYLTPRVNRGNYGLEGLEPSKNDHPHQDSLFHW